MEELLMLRRTLQEVPTEANSHYMRELAAHYPAQWQQLYRMRAAFTLEYLRANLQRGLAEGLYLPSWTRTSRPSTGWRKPRS